MKIDINFIWEYKIEKFVVLESLFVVELLIL